ncbi:phage tail sheath family protein [Pseudomonas synxantha]|uniref:Phage tail sheath protein FI n=1 Tax=Pseudomonas synxantha TaxID=47883 RepID=A0AAU8U7I8_9PSED|nr:phage tail sheath C-terminal domain-containing protein [Pseudomonas synxantha]AKA86362.1 Phage tail sheath protein FI [Pseudomonas synxantha]
MAIYTVPGVYVEEPFKLALSIPSGATAVPVFALDAINFSTKATMANRKTIKDYFNLADDVAVFNTWLDIQAKTVTAPFGNEDAQTRAKGTEDVLNRCPLYLALKAYFDNGGGRCYVVPVAKLSEKVPALDDATLIVQAGSTHDAFAGQVQSLCKMGNSYFALYDGPNDDALTSTTAASAGGKYEANEFAAVYYPWLQKSVPKEAATDGGEWVDVPPSAVMAGIYCTVDRDRGVWKAPANVQVGGGLRPKYQVPDSVDGLLNAPAHAINVIRSFRGAGTLVWGARTLKSNSDTWRYVPVRRLFCAAERDIRTTMSTALFEPNSQPTWEQVRSAVTSYLHRLWQQGALMGDTPQQAYFVQVGLGTTMSADDVNQGKMIVKVGMAAVRPAEFIILQLTQDVAPA